MRSIRYISLKSHIFTVAILVSILSLASCAKKNSGSYAYYNYNSVASPVLEGGGDCCCCCCNTCGDTKKVCTSKISIMDEEGNPISNARVNLYGSAIGNFVSNLYGEVNITKLSTGSYILNVVKSGYKSLIQTFEVKDGVCPSVELVLQARGTSNVECSALFTVQDTLGIGIQGAVVTFDGQEYITDLNGNVTIDDIVEGDYTYTVTKTGYEEITGTYGASFAICPELTIDMQELPCSPSFTLQYLGTPVSSQTFTFIIDEGDPLTLSTGINGVFTVDDLSLAPGSHSYSVTYTIGSDNYSKSGSFDYEAGSCPASIDINMSKDEPLIPAVCSPTFTIVDADNPLVPFIVSDPVNNHVLVVFDKGTSGEKYFNATSTGIFTPTDLENRTYLYDVYTPSDYSDRTNLVYDNSDGSCPDVTVVIVKATCSMSIEGPRYAMVASSSTGSPLKYFSLSTDSGWTGSLHMTVHINSEPGYPGYGDIQEECDTAPGTTYCNMTLPVGSYYFDFVDLTTGYSYNNSLYGYRNFIINPGKNSCNYAGIVGASFSVWSAYMPLVTQNILSNGMPVNNAKVDITVNDNPYSSEGSNIFDIRSNEEGVATARLAPGSYSYEVSNPSVFGNPIQTGLSLSVPESNDNITLPNILFDYFPNLTFTVQKRAQDGINVEPLMATIESTGVYINSDSSGVVSNRAAPNRTYEFQVNGNDGIDSYQPQNIFVTVGTTDIIVPTVILERY